MDLVSIIMPVYNKKAYLKDSIESVITQTYSNFELIIINDGSTDSSEKIILKYAEKDSRIKYIKQINKGVAASRNIGISIANGDYITFLDADDLYKDTFLEKMLGVITYKNVAICNYDYKLNNQIIKTKWKCSQGDILIDYINNKCVPNTNSWLLKKEFILMNNLNFPVSKSWGEDMSFFIKVLCHETNVMCIQESLTMYNLNVSNSLSTNSINKIYADIAWLEESKQYIQQNILDNNRKKSAIVAIDTYRIPALLIYRLNLNKNLVERSVYNKVYKDVEKYINQFRFSNGLRSFKLFIYKLKL